MNDLTSTQLGQYQILLKIFESSTKALYRAFDKKLGREVMVEVILPGKPYRKEFIEKIKSHSRILASFDQLSIARLLDCGLYDNYLCLVFDVNPKSVLKMPIQRTYEWNQAARLLVPITQALAFAHQKNIPHYGLSSSSILVSRDGSLFLYDFGIDNLVQEEITKTTPGYLCGGDNYHYAAPEVLLKRDFDLRADVYSFGMIFYELVFGHRRFESPNLYEDLVKLATPMEIKEYKRTESKIPGSIRYLMSRILHPDPKQRFNSMLEVSVLFTRIALGHKVNRAMVRKPLKTIRPPIKPATILRLSYLGILIAIIVTSVLNRTKIFEFFNGHFNDGLEEIQVNTTKPFLEETQTGSTPIVSTPTNITAEEIAQPDNNIQMIQNLPVLFGEPLPFYETTLQPNTISRAILVGRWGMGKFSDFKISKDGQTLFIATSIGIFELDREDFSIKSYIDTITEVNCVELSPDGQFIASGERDGLIRIWDQLTGEEILTLSGHRGSVNSLSFHPEGRWLASASDDHTVRIWDLENGTLFNTLVGHTQPVNSVAFSPDGTFLLSGGQDYSVKYWIYLSGDLVKSQSVNGKINDISFSPNEEVVVIAEESGLVEIYDQSNSQTIKILSGLAAPALSVEYDRSGKLITGTDGNGKLLVWDSSTGQKVFENISNQFAHELSYGSKYSHIAHFSSDGNSLITANWDNAIMEWNTENWEQSNYFQSNSYFIENLVISPNSKYLAVQRRNRVVDVFDLQTSKQLFQLSGKIVSARAFSPNSKYFALLTNPGTVSVFQMPTGKEVYKLGGHTRVKDVYFSRDGKFLVAGDHSDLRLWSMNSGQEVKKTINYTGSGCSIVYDWLGEPIFYITRFDFIDTFNHREEDICRIQRVGWMESLEFSEDESFAVAGGASRVQFWNYAEDQENLILMQNTYGLVARTLAMDYNEELVAAGMDDGSIRIWSALDGKELVRLYGHKEEITSLAFSPNNQYLVSAGLDGTIFIWGVQSSE